MGSQAVRGYRPDVIFGTEIVQKFGSELIENPLTLIQPFVSAVRHVTLVVAPRSNERALRG